MFCANVLGSEAVEEEVVDVVTEEVVTEEEEDEGDEEEDEEAEQEAAQEGSAAGPVRRSEAEQEAGQEAGQEARPEAEQEAGCSAPDLQRLRPGRPAAGRGPAGGHAGGHADTGWEPVQAGNGVVGGPATAWPNVPGWCQNVAQLSPSDPRSKEATSCKQIDRLPQCRRRCHWSFRPTLHL